jgi:hypothetical protein
MFSSLLLLHIEFNFEIFFCLYGIFINFEFKLLYNYNYN